MRPELRVVGFLAIGWMCGGGLSVPALRQFSRLLPATMAYIAGVMAACAGMGWVMARWLGSSPAVVSLQLIRLICVILFAGWLPRILARR